jgi:recombination associated protein RdgC
MWFKNLVVYRLPTDWSWSAAALEESLGRRALQPCSALEMASTGWVSPSVTGRLLHTVERQHLLALGVDQKLLPGSVIRQEAERRAQHLAAEQGFPVGRRQMRELKARVGDELRARALTRRRITRAWIDSAAGWLVVDAAGATRAEELIDTLRDTLGSLAVQPLQTELGPQRSMTEWLMRGEAPRPFGVDQDLELQAVDASKATVRYTRHALDGREVRAHLAAGKAPMRLGLTWNGRVSFVLTDKMQVKRVAFLEMKSESSSDEDVDAAEQFDLDFTVMAGELARLLLDLTAALGGASLPQAAAA